MSFAPQHGDRMPTYLEIQSFVYERHGFVAQTCWIADVKAEYGLTARIAPNRVNKSSRAKPCPDGKRKAIEEALKHFRMI